MSDRGHHYGDHEAVSEGDVDVPCARAGRHDEDSAGAHEDQGEGADELGGGAAEDVVHTRVEAREGVGWRLPEKIASRRPGAAGRRRSENKKARFAALF